MSAKPMIRIMLLDDHPFMLRGLEDSLKNEHYIQVVGSFSSSLALSAALREQPADLVLLDYSLGPDEVDGLNLVRWLKNHFPGVLLLVISAQHSPATVSMVLRCGADGFMGKDEPPAQLPIAIKSVVAGRGYLSSAMTDLLYNSPLSIDDNQTSFLVGEVTGDAKLTVNSSLTVREHEVLRCCLDGLSVTQIAEKFSRSIKTISTQKQSAFKKLGVRSDNELFKIRDQLNGL